MKALKRIGFAILLLLVAVLTLAVFVPKDCEVQRQITINRPASEVFEYVKYLKNQDKFSAWSNLDPVMKRAYYGQDGEIGFVSTCKSKRPDLGKREHKIVAIEDGKRIDYEWNLTKPFKSTYRAYLITEPIGPSETRVTWGFSGDMGYPGNLRLLALDVEDAVGSDFESSLGKLKRIMESR